MQESKRTLVYVATAVVMVALAAGTHWAMQPAGLAEFSDVGEPFFPDFSDPNAATGLRVAAFNKDTARVDVFNVDFKDGLWRIPSHHNYPADGEKRLAETASSIIGIKREALASTSADDFRRLGVLDPLDEKVTGTEGRGDRVTLFAGDNILADYIIGKKVEGQTNLYHVRKPGENRTYRAELNIDISTKFADWIEPGLLDVNRGDLREIVIDRYSVDEVRGEIVRGDVSVLSRDSSTAPWALEGLPANEKVNTSGVNSVINALEDLKIVGVRAKPDGLIAALKGERDGLVDPRALAEKGFFLTEQGFVSNEGEVHVATADGVRYVLQFGEVFTGSDVEIEIGRDSGDGEKSSATGDGAEAAAEEADSAANKQSRYLFIRTGFDESLIPGPGEKPTAPQPPEPAAAPEETPADDTSADKPETDEAAPDAEEEKYQAALAEYEAQLKTWEADQKAHEEKLEKGRARVKELNARFADWYYVISASTFDEIRVDRAALVEQIDPAPENGEAPANPPAGTSPAPPVPDAVSPDTDDAEPDTDAAVPQDADSSENDEAKRPPAEPGETPAADAPTGDEASTTEESPVNDGTE
ncbi:MAG: DUF4340 domain-containing protein [Planctomycetaceae bacterium]|nr:DUF4340 domain-containing protein [Planctomycetaceae bacterium]